MVEVELERGELAVELELDDSGVVGLYGRDPAGLGVEFPMGRRLDFEDEPQGLASVPQAEGWRWGHPRPYAATGADGRRVWATNLGAPGWYVRDGLWTPAVAIPDNPSAPVMFRVRHEFTVRTHGAEGRIEHSADDGATWDLEARFDLRSGPGWRTTTVGVPRNASVRTRFLPDLPTRDRATGWTVDWIEWVDLPPTLVILESTGDADGDGTSNGDEIAAGLDPRSQDPDLDGVFDGSDNCSLVANEDQRDLVHPGGGGDACEDADGDGVVDADDNCPVDPNPGQQDGDLDGRGDACDAYPDRRLVVRPVSPEWIAQGVPYVLEYRLENEDGDLQADLAGLTYTLEVSGPARFEGPVDRGRVLDWGDGRAVRVEFVGGMVRLPLVADGLDVLVLGGHGEPQDAVRFHDGDIYTFERSDEGFVSSTPEFWTTGPPVAGEARARSGSNVLAARLPEGMSSRQIEIESPSYTRYPGDDFYLEYWYWSDLPQCREAWAAQSSVRPYRETGDVVYGRSGRWLRIRTPLRARDATFRGAFVVTAEQPCDEPGVVLFDDIAIRGMKHRIRVYEADADPDRDGWDNVQELEAGTNPASWDTDGDLVKDSADNCPLVRNGSQSDVITPNGIGDACDDGDLDGVMDADDNCPYVGNPEQEDPDQDGRGSACDICPDNWNPRQLDDDADGRGNACEAYAGLPGVEHLPDRVPVAGVRIEIDPHRRVAWVTDHVASRLHAIDLVPGRLVRSYRLEGWPEAVRLDPSGNGLWLLTARWDRSREEDRVEAGTIAFIDLERSTLTRRFDVDVDPRDLAALAGGRLAVTGTRAGEGLLSIYDAETGTLLDRMPTPEDGTLLAPPAGDRLYVGSRVPAPPRVTRIDVDPSGRMYPVSVLFDTPEISTLGRGWFVSDGSRFIGGGGAVVTSSDDPAADLAFQGGLRARQVAHAIWDPWAGEILALQGNSLRLHDGETLETLRVVELWSPGGALVKQRKNVVVLEPDVDELLIQRFEINHVPEADAGEDQVLECEADLAARGTLDGRGTRDRDSPPGTTEDIVAWSWREGDVELGTTPVVTTSFALGRHDVTLTVTDASDARDDDDVIVEVVDTIAPSGGVAFPASGACFGPGALPVVIEDDFADACDPAIARTWSPAGPIVEAHGDHVVTVTATDRAGNEASDVASFTVDRIAPEVAWVPLPPRLVLPVRLEFTATDDDGAFGDPVHEWIEVDGCRVYDGFEDGDGDGRLVDETILLDDALLCRVYVRCGKTQWPAARLRVTAEDCGGNRGSDEVVAPWPLAIVPDRCRQER